MSLSRIVIIASICFGLTAAAAQQRDATTAATAQPPLFQGIMVDAKGEDGRQDFPGFRRRWSLRRPQIDGIWVTLFSDNFSVGSHVDPFYFLNALSVDLLHRQTYLQANPAHPSNFFTLAWAASPRIPPMTAL